MSPKKGYGPFSQPEPFEIVAPYREDLAVAAECLSTAHIQNTRAQYTLPAFERRLAYPANRDGISAHFADPSVRKSMDGDLALIDQDDTLIMDLELTIVREATRHDADAFHRLRSVPGIGKVLALTILYEIHAVPRFDRVQECASDARLVTCVHQSAGKTSPRMRGLSLNRCWARVFDACQRWKRRPH